MSLKRVLLLFSCLSVYFCRSVQIHAVMKDFISAAATSSFSCTPQRRGSEPAILVASFRAGIRRKRRFWLRLLRLALGHPDAL